MDKDPRYQWIESRLITTLEPKRDTLLQLIQNADTRFVNCFFLLQKSLLCSG
jgi:hypothetical protein